MGQAASIPQGGGRHQRKLKNFLLDPHFQLTKVRNTNIEPDQLSKILGGNIFRLMRLA